MMESRHYHFTVWRFESPTSGEVVVVVRTTKVDDMQYQHLYQRILWRGWATSKAEALSKAAIN